MKRSDLKSAVLLVALSLQLSGTLMAADLVLIGNHPTSILTGYPTLHTLKAHDGRIYCGYGEWWYSDSFPAVVIASYDPGRHAFHLEFSAYTDSIGIFREIGGVLYAPSTDPVLYGEPRDYSYRRDGVWRDSNPVNMYHVLDVGTVDGTDLWLVGSKSTNETTNYNHAVFRSPDGGRTWQDVTLQSARTDDRYYWGFGLRGKFYVVDTVYNGTNATRSNVATYRHVNKATAMGSGTDEFIVGVTGWVKGTGSPTPRPLVSFDTQSWRTLRNNVFDFTISGSNLFTVETNTAANSIWMGSAVTALGASWQRLDFSNVPSNAKCIEVLDQVVYIGDAQGRLWAGRWDGGALPTTPATVTNELTDGFGAGLSFDGEELAVGAPDYSGTVPLCGQVTVWAQRGTSLAGTPWRRTSTIDPPAPSFSGWFGKQVALKSNLLAIVEAGRDTSRHDRGSAAVVHVYECTNEQWLARATLPHPYAQAVALDAGFLAVGTGGLGYADNGLYLYSTGSNGLQLALSTNLVIQAPGDFWRPTARVVLDRDICAFGTVGDAGFTGGPGEVQIYQRDDANVWQLRQALHSTSTIPAGLSLPPDRFGLALALAKDWLAVGAPCDDTAALQAGAVHLYRRTNSPAGAASFVLHQTIHSPVDQATAGFGSSVAIKGPTLIVGCPGIERNNQRHRGAVFVYRRQQDVWRNVAEITLPSQSTGEFGAAVAFGADWLAAASRYTGDSTNLEDRVTLWPFRPPGGELFSAHHTATGAFELSMRGEVGRTYHLQAANELPSATWTNVITFTLTTPATSLLDPATNLRQRLYRLRSEPEAR